MTGSEPTTEAYGRFCADDTRLFWVVHFIGFHITRADEAALTAAKVLIKGDIDEERRARYEETIERGGAGVQETWEKQGGQFFARLVLQRAVDNFLAYITDLMRLVFTVRPEALTSSETVRLEEIMRFPTMDELLTFLIERRVERLAYQSLSDLNADLDGTLGLTLFTSDADLKRATRLVATRNLIVHNRAVVNPAYLRSVPDSDRSEGDEIWIDADMVFEELAFLRDAARRIDDRAADHFSLPRVEPIGPTDAPLGAPDT